jgi:hypothetical protein
MKTIRMATIKADQDYQLCSCGAVKLNRFQCFNGCGVVKYPEFDCLQSRYVEQYASNLQQLIQQERGRAFDRLIQSQVFGAVVDEAGPIPERVFE